MWQFKPRKREKRVRKLYGRVWWRLQFCFKYQCLGGDGGFAKKVYICPVVSFFDNAHTLNHKLWKIELQPLLA